MNHQPFLVDAAALQGVLRRAGQLLSWEGSGILPEGPEQALVDYMAEHRTSARPLVLALLHTFRRIYGGGVAKVLEQVERYGNALDLFVGEYGAGPVALARAPARINILGEHVDYVSYLPTEVMPFASREHDMLLLFRPNKTAAVRGRSTLAGTDPTEFAIEDGPRDGGYAGETLEAKWLSYLHETGIPARDWSNYIRASVFFCRMAHPRIARGFDFLLDSTVPAAGGASSSSTLVVLSGAAIRISNGIALEPGALAQDSAKAEWYVGTRGGNMDHCTMCLSQRQHALHLNFSPFRAEHVPLHRFRYRWVTFFAHPADKSGEVLLEYNERSAVSRLLIPALLERQLGADPAKRARWNELVATLAANTADITAAESARGILAELPECLTLGQIRSEFPKVYTELETSYPHLAENMGERPLKIRARALHHVGEVIRVREAVGILNELFSSSLPEEPEKTEPGLRAVGDLICSCHESMRNLYELTTPDIDELMEILLGHPGVYGARLMGGGFGGNILALASKEYVAELVDRAQSEFYGPRGRDAIREGSVMVSTPGEGFSALRLRDVLARAIINASAIWWNWPKYESTVETSIHELLEIPDLDAFRPLRPIRPVIVGGGSGAVRLDGDYRNPASLNIVGDRTSLETVLQTLAALPFETLPAVLVVSPEMRDVALPGLELPPELVLAVQAEPLGTGHAVAAAMDAIGEEDSDALVVWGSQPLLCAETLARSVMYYQALGSAAMLFPTAVTRTPYAPIRRDLHGYVVDSYETSMEGAPVKPLGETNIGTFVLRMPTARTTLAQLHDELWDAENGRYRTENGMLGFPNQMARALVRQSRAVIALPIARVEESLGLRNREGFEEVRRIVGCRTRI